MIEISDGARDLIKQTLAENPGKLLRIVVEGDGFAGPYLDLELDQAEDYETIVSVDGIDLLISEQARRYSEITTIQIFSNHFNRDLLSGQVS